MYFIKTRGTEKVSDFVQIRDNNFALLDQIKFTSLDKKLKELFTDKCEAVKKIIIESEYEKIIQL